MSAALAFKSESLAPSSSPRERRRFRRVPTDLSGRIMLANGEERDCRIADLSAGGARLSDAGTMGVNDGVVIYLRDFGRLTGHVVRSTNEESAIIFDLSRYKQEKLVERLTWIMNRDLLGFDEDRREGRHQGSGEAIVIRDDGSRLTCQLLDFSMVGMALRTAGDRPMIGEWVQIGSTYGKVARYFDGGFAVDFENQRM
jgi:hypothetical protein